MKRIFICFSVLAHHLSIYQFVIITYRLSFCLGVGAGISSRDGI